MPSQSKRQKPRAGSPLPLPLLVLGAFLLGAGATWLVMREPAARPEASKIDSFLPPPGVSAPGGTVAPTTTTLPPDVSQLAPAEAARTLANWNYDRQEWAHAIEHYEEALRLGADNPDVRTDLANCYRFLGQLQRALEQYEIAQKQNPLHENSLFNQISLFGDLLHDEARAAAAARDFVARFPQSPQAGAARQRLEQATSKAK